MNKLRTQIILAINLFFILLVGGTIVFYTFFAEDYYLRQKISSINSAFDTIQQLDLDELLLEEEDLSPFDEQNYSILICNEQMEALYYSNLTLTDNFIQTKVKEKLHRYSAVPTIRYNDATDWHFLTLRGLVTQDNTNFYVYIRESTRPLHDSIRYTVQFLWKLLVLLLFGGFIFSCILARWIAKPLEYIQLATNRLSKNDFSVRLPARQPRNEIGRLAADINLMSDKIQRDINDLSNYNYLLLKQNRNMAEFEDMRKKLVSTFTHELKTPLAIISSQLELLQYEYDLDKKDYYYSSIMEEIDKMSKLISTILRNSKLEEQLSHVELRWLGLSELIQELLPKYENWLSSQKLHFTSSIEEDCVAYIDRTQIEQVINNYMMNAVRHTKAGRNVHLLLKSEEEFFYLSVYNDGPRLPAKELDRIWTGFYQSGKSTSERDTEFGLGLYIVKDIMNHHDGSCGVLNKENGVEFWIRLPKNQI